MSYSPTIKRAIQGEPVIRDLESLGKIDYRSFMLTPENYTKGFLMDDELMAGVSPHPETPNMFCAFVLQHRTGEYLGYEFFQSLDPALAQINSIQRPWSFEKVGGCGGCDGGKCGEGACSREGGGGCCKT